MTSSDRTYSQFCGVARALDLVGNRWALLIVRELVLGPRRFTDLLVGLPGVSTNVLSSRLRQLERGGLVQRRMLPPPAASAVYELTEYGRALEPALFALGRWGAQSLGPRGEDQILRSHWLAVALKAFFHPETAEGPRGAYELRLREGSFLIRVHDGEVDVQSDGVGDADLVLEADDDILVAVLAGAIPLSEGLRAGGVRVLEGDLGELERFVEMFRFAEPAR
jgi:DNA-binding HxlR family transcriptional regulator